MKNILILFTVLFSYSATANPHTAPLPQAESVIQTTPAVQRTYTVGNSSSYIVVVDGEGNLVLTTVPVEGSESDSRFVKPILIVVQTPQENP